VNGPPRPAETPKTGPTTSSVARRSSETAKRVATKAPEKTVVFDQPSTTLPPLVSSTPRQSVVLSAVSQPDHAHVGDAPPTVAYATPTPVPTLQKKCVLYESVG